MSYSLREVAAMLGLTPAQVRAFANDGLLQAEKDTRGELRFGFQDLILLRTASELTAARIPQTKLRRALSRLREQLPAGRPLTAVRIATDGHRVVVRDGDAVWNPESGQALFDFSVSELVAKAAPLSLRNAREARESADQTTADEWFELGCELELSDAAQARDAYERAVTLDPSHADAHVNLGRLLHEQGAAEEAAKHYAEALATAPQHETAAFNLGVALEDLGRLDDALEAYRRALAIDPRNADAHYNMAGIYERKGEKQAAIRHLKEYRGRQ